MASPKMIKPASVEGSAKEGPNPVRVPRVNGHLHQNYRIKDHLSQSLTTYTFYCYWIL